MKLVFDHDRTVNDWIERRFGYVVLQRPADSVGVIDREGVLRGAFVTTWRNDTTAELHLFGRTSNDTWKEYFAFVFSEAHRLEISTSRQNKAIKKAAPKFGFKFEGVAKHYYGPGRDALRFYMTPDDCRWIKANGLAVQIS